jgi:hypothetical protein
VSKFHHREHGVHGEKTKGFSVFSVNSVVNYEVENGEKDFPRERHALSQLRDAR